MSVSQRGDPVYDRASAGASRRGDAALMCVAALLGGVAVAVGAFGAHALDGQLTEKAQGWYQTATHYLLLHAVLAVACSAMRPVVGPAGCRAGWLLCAGAVVFSGTLLAMAFGAPRTLGAVTPIGGVLLLAGWGVLAGSAWRAARR
ncbi:MAG: DUF423 domain-containing protein [Pseudomonadota bacterium]